MERVEGFFEAKVAELQNCKVITVGQCRTHQEEW